LYMEAFNNKDEDYKERVTTKAICVPFDSFPLTTMKGTGA